MLYLVRLNNDPMALTSSNEVPLSPQKRSTSKIYILEANPLTRVFPTLAEMAHAFVLEADVLHVWLPVYEQEKGD